MGLFLLEFLLLVIGAHLFSKPFFAGTKESWVSVSMFVGGTGAGLFLAGVLLFDGISGTILISTDVTAVPGTLGLLLIVCLAVIYKNKCYSYMYFLMLSLVLGALTLARIPHAALPVGLVYGLTVAILGYIFYCHRRCPEFSDLH